MKFASCIAGVALLSSTVSANRFLPEGLVEARQVAARDARLSRRAPAWSTTLSTDDALTAVVQGVKVMQDSYFDLLSGTYDTGNDWTRAAVATQLTSAISTMSHALLNSSSSLYDVKISTGFIADRVADLMSYYYGQNAVSLAYQAYDDMQWVALGWLELLKLITLNTDIYNSIGSTSPSSYNHAITLVVQDHWFAKNWVPAFAHRARVFWDRASQGWNETICGGGMFWDWRGGKTYKNTITNTLFITSSASMYLYFPGDSIKASQVYNDSAVKQAPDNLEDTDMSSGKQQLHLDAATKTYDWLAGVDMFTAKGLYGDGYHAPDNVTCSEFSSDVFSYNQGVILSGQRALYTITANETYLDDAHTLIQNVINATGWDLSADQPYETGATTEDPLTNQWGLGRVGVMEDPCDADQSCSQDETTFKGIFWHHLATFCAPFDDVLTLTSTTDDHTEACAQYLNWVKHNAIAALGTRDADGKFGMWWTWGLFNNASASSATKRDASAAPGKRAPTPVALPEPVATAKDDNYSFMRRRDPAVDAAMRASVVKRDSDPNNNGRGRVVETQAGGISVIRCFYEMQTRLG